MSHNCIHDLLDPLAIDEEKQITFKKESTEVDKNYKELFTYVPIDSLISNDASSTDNEKMSKIPSKAEKPSLKPCPVCSKSFTNLASHMTKHRRKQSRPPLIVCRFCTETYTNRRLYSIHLRTHPESRPYKCETCSATFPKFSWFNQHKMDHIRDKPFKCTLCDEGFVDLARLNNHLKKHLYECHLCGKKFIRSNANALKSHILTHKDDFIGEIKRIHT